MASFKPLAHALVFASLLGVLAVPATGGTIRHDVADSNYTALAADSRYAAVGKLGTSSGTLIESTWVLTAAHLVFGASITTVTFDIGGTVYNAIEWIPHPLYTGDLTAGYDIALVRLDTAVAGVTPAVRYTGSAEQFKTATLVGYGATGTGLTGYVSGTAGTKRAGQNVIDAFGTAAGWSNRILLADFDSPIDPGASTLGSSTPLSLEYCIAPGDSGGGWFITIGANTYLVGVSSFLSNVDGNSNASYSDLMGATRVSSFDDWISDQLTARHWAAGVSGEFSNASLWVDSSLPGAAQTAVFNVAGTYTVALTGPVSNSRLRVRKGAVTLDLAGHDYTLTGGPEDASLVVGKQSGDSAASLLVIGGAALSGTDAALAAKVGTTGLLTLDGAGTTLSLSGDLTLGGTAAGVGGTGGLTINAGANLAVGGVLRIWTNGSLGLAGGTGTVAAVNQAGGTSTGGGTLSVTGELSWTGGTMSGSGLTTVAGSATINGAANKLLSGRTLTLNGPATWSNTGLIRTDHGAILNNNVSFAVWSDSSMTWIGNGARPVFNNAGTFTKSVGTGTTSISGIAFNNLGAVEVHSGTLILSGGGVSSGSFSVSSEAKLVFGGGTHDLTGAAFANAGQIEFGGNLTALFNAPVALPGQIVLSTGSFSFAAQTDLAGPVTWNGVGTIYLGDGASLNVAELLDAQTNASISRMGGGDRPTLNLLGTFRKSAGAATSVIGDVALNNLGTVEALSGTLRFDGPIVQLPGSTLTGGTWKVGGGATLNLAGSAAIAVNQADISLNGAGAAFANLNSLSLNAGSLALLGGASFTTLGDLDNAGALHVGTASTLTIDGDFAQSDGWTVVDGTFTVLGGEAHITGGTLTLNVDGGAAAPLAVLLDDTAHAQFNAAQNLTALTIAGEATADLAAGGLLHLVTDALTIGDDGMGSYTGQLDLNDNAMTIHYGDGASPLTDVAAMLAGGYNAGAWDGTGIVSGVAGDSGLALGYADGADGVVSGLSPGRVLVQYALPGDITLDGRVDGDDYDWFLGFFGTTSGATWTMGDFTYDGRVDGDDYDWFLGYSGQSGPLLTSGVYSDGQSLPATTTDAGLESGGLLATGDATFDSAFGKLNLAAPTATPEPGTLAMLGIGTLGVLGALVGRRRRR